MRTPQAGFGLVEVVLALTVSSIGLMAVAGASMGIGTQSSLARWDADQSLAARRVFERTAAGAYLSVTSGQGPVSFGNLSMTATTTVTVPAPRLKHVRLDVTPSVPRRPVVFETRMAAPRPLPVAP